MIIALLAAASLTTKVPPTPAPAPPPVDASIFQDASHAIEVGRLEEAKLLLARAISAGYRGALVARLTAELDFASQRYGQAWAAYQRLASSPDKRRGDCEKGAISALEIGRYADAKPLVECAT